MDLARNLRSIFHEEVGPAFREEGVSQRTPVEHYIVQLLAATPRSRSRTSRSRCSMLSGDGAPPRRERRQQLRDIGDTSLYLSGFWSDTWRRGPVDVDYYIGMGGSAYRRAGSQRAGHRADGRSVQRRLRRAGRRTSSASWARWRLVSRRMAVPASNPDVVRLYRRWQETKSESAAARLAALGVVHAGAVPGGPCIVRSRAGRGRPGSSVLAPSAARAGGAVPGRDAPGDRRFPDRRGASARRGPAWRARRGSSCWCGRTAASSAWGCSSTRRALANLERHDPATAGIDEQNFADFCLAVEGVSHFVYVALRAADDRRVSRWSWSCKPRSTSSPAACWWRTSTTRDARTLRPGERLLRRRHVRRRTSTPRSGSVTGGAITRPALRRRARAPVCRPARMDALLAELRRFHRMDLTEKLGHIAHLAS